MLAKIISAGALTLLLSGGALAYIPQQHNKARASSMRLTARRLGTRIPRGRTLWVADPVSST